MTWIQRYRLRHYLNDSIWIGPCSGLITAMVVVRLAEFTDRSLGWQMTLNPDAARTVLITLASSMFTFVVFVSSALLIALQLASAQLTPRIIALVFRDLVTKVSMTAFVFTLTLTVATVLRIGESVPSLTMYLAAYSCVASLALFLYLIDHIGKILRPPNALRNVAILGRRIIEEVYRPDCGAERGQAVQTRAQEFDRRPTATVTARKGGVVLACDVGGIVELARWSDCVLELVPQVGDFVAEGDALFRVHGGEGPPPAALRKTVAIGAERSLEQDPTFAFRILVDTASKALSPAINDPTTAVLAIDQLQHLLSVVGNRHLADGRVRDSAGATRLLYGTPTWVEFVSLAVTEVRQYGCQSIQVSRRLHAMLESLLRVLPAERGPALRAELELVDRSATRSFAEPEDQAMAADGDRQGMGGRYVNGGEHINHARSAGRRGSVRALHPAGSGPKMTCGGGRFRLYGTKVQLARQGRRRKLPP